MRRFAQPTRPQRRPGFLAAFRLGIGAVALWGMATVLLTCALRITYPYELEWMEGGVLQHIHRICRGEPIYVPPSFHFVPFIYPPLYYYVSAAVVPIVGGGFLGPRLVSLGASIGCAAVISLFVYRETRRKLPALAAAALYAGTFAVVDGWFDLARVDSLFPLLVLGAAYLIRFGRGPRHTVAAGLLLTAAFFTKQSTLVFAGPLLLFCLVYQPRRLPILLKFSVVPCVLISVWLNLRSDGWFGYYIFALPRQHAWVPRSDYLRFWLADLLPHVPIALGMAILLAASRWKYWRRLPAVGFYTAMTAGALAVSWLSRLHTGGDINVVLPAFATVAILFGLAAAELPGAIRRLPGMETADRARIEATVLTAVVIQLLLLCFNPFNWIPSDADRRMGDQLVDFIRQVPGDVVVPAAPYLAARAGKPTTAHHMALMDVLRAPDSDEGKQVLLEDMYLQLRNPAWRAILLHRREGWYEEFEQSRLPDDFRFDRVLIESSEVFRPKSGTTLFVPTHLFRRKETVSCQNPSGKSN